MRSKLDRMLNSDHASVYNPLVSVVIPTYNRPDFVCEAIDSVLAQNYTNFEIVVVNDGSKDNTAEVLKKYSEPVRVINKENGGLASARNRGIEESRGELIAFLDDDDRWLPNKLEVQVPEFLDPEVCLVHSAARFFDESTGWDKIQFIGDIGFHDLLSMKILYGQTVIVRKSVLDEVGSFDNQFHSSVEDVELWLRISVGHKIKGIDICTAEVRCHEAAMHNNLQRMFSCNMQVLKKYSTAHTNCAECRAALKHARRYLKDYAFDQSKIRAREAFQKKMYVEAIKNRLSAYRYDPMAIPLMPLNAVKKLLRRSAG